MRGMRILGAAMAFAMYEYNAIAPGGGGGTPGTIVPSSLAAGQDTADRTSYVTSTVTAGTGTFSQTQGVATFISFIAQNAGGSPDPSSVTALNGDTLTKVAGLPTAFSQNNKVFTYAYNPTTTAATQSITVSYGATTMLEFIFHIWQATGCELSGGISAAWIPDSTNVYPSGANGTHLNNDDGGNGTGFACQQQWHANNVTVLVGCAGSPDLAITPGSGQTTLATAGASPASTTVSLSYATGTKARMDMSWTGSFSQHGHVIELRAANTTAPTMTATAIGAFQNTSGVTPQTMASVTVATGDLLILAVLNPRASAVSNPTSIGGTLSATWTQIGSAIGFNTIAANTERLNIYYSTDATGSGTIAVSWSGNQDGGAMELVQIHNQAGSGQIVQNVSASRDATDTAPTVALSAFGNVNNGTLLIVGHNGNSGTGRMVREGAGLVKLNQETAVSLCKGEVTFSTPSTGLSILWCHGNLLNPAATLVGTPTLHGEMGLELKAA